MSWCHPLPQDAPYLLSSHQEKVNGSDVDTDVLTQILEDFSDGGAGAEGEGRAGAGRQQHAAVFG